MMTLLLQPVMSSKITASYRASGTRGKSETARDPTIVKSDISLYPKFQLETLVCIRNFSLKANDRFVRQRCMQRDALSDQTADFRLQCDDQFIASRS